MNVQRDFNPILYEILSIPHGQLSKAQLSKELHIWLINNNYIQDGVVHINGILNEVSGIPFDMEYNIQGDNWWRFVTKVYKKWKI